MDQTTFTALIALATAIATGMGVKFFDFLIASRKGTGELDTKKFDDGVLRRQEMIKEIESLRGIIEKKDGEISKLHDVIESYRKQFFDLSINYTKLQGDYKDAVEKLEELKQNLVQKIDEKKEEIIKHANGKMEAQSTMPVHPDQLPR